MGTVVGPKYLARTGTTGNNVGDAVMVEPGALKVGLQFTVEAIGGGPTVTYHYEGSLDKVNWFDVAYITDASNTMATAAIAITTVSSNVCWLDGGSRYYQWIRVVTTANTNVTYRAELYSQMVS